MPSEEPSAFEREFKKNWDQSTAPIGGCLGKIAPVLIVIAIVILMCFLYNPEFFFPPYCKTYPERCSGR